MTAKGFFAGGIPGETYSQGVRRRIRTGGIIWVLTLSSIALAYAVFSLSGSVWATLAMAVLSGFFSSRADVHIDPIRGDGSKRSDNRVWLMLFVPALILLAVGSVYAGVHARTGLEVFRAGLVAGLFGWVLGFTIFMLRSAHSRAHA